MENPGQTALNDVRTPTPGPVLPVELVRTTPSKRSPLSQHVSSSLHVADASAHTENTRSAQRIKVEQHDGNTEVQADEPSDSSQRTGPDSHLYLDCIDPVHSPSAPSAVSTASYAPSPTAGRPMAAASPHTTASTAMQSFPPSSPLVKEERRSSLPFSQQESQAGTSCNKFPSLDCGLFKLTGHDCLAPKLKQVAVRIGSGKPLTPSYRRSVWQKRTILKKRKITSPLYYL